jgi:hypothetical protein
MGVEMYLGVLAVCVCLCCVGVCVTVCLRRVQRHDIGGLRTGRSREAAVNFYLV